MDSAPHPKPRIRLHWWGAGVIVAVVVVASTLSVLYFIPFSQSATETTAFAIVVPYNASELECTLVGFDHTGTYAFEVQLPIQATGDIFLLIATGPNGSQPYRSPGNVYFDGSFPVSDSETLYRFCLETVGINYTPLGGAAAGIGTLTYAHDAPIL
ncbi:MAG: hypothetical protein WAN87_07085 [Thermoplasmata archaeon]